MSPARIKLGLSAYCGLASIKSFTLTLNCLASLLKLSPFLIVTGFVSGGACVPGLAGVTSGVHPATAGQYFIRRIRIASESPLVDVIKAHGYKTEYQINFDGSLDRSTIVAEFPCKYPDGTKSADDMTVFEQLEDVKFLQQNWSDNSVSVTAYYTIEELPEIKKYLEDNFKDNFKTLSFLLKADASGFKQMPFEAITKKEYEWQMNFRKPITSLDISINEEDISGVDECAGGACPIK